MLIFMRELFQISKKNIFTLLLLGGVMALLSLLSGCMGSSVNTSKQVEKKLSEKYGEDFVVTEIGNRFNTGSATLYCHPESNENINFTVVYDFSDETITDDYMIRKSAVNLDSEISELSSKSGIGFSSITVFHGAIDDNLDGNEDVAEFIRKSGAHRLYMHLAVNADDISDESDAAVTLDSLHEISRKYDNIDVLAVLFAYHSDDYNKCSSELSEQTKANNLWFKSFSPISDYTVKIEKSIMNQSAAEFWEVVKG